MSIFSLSNSMAASALASSVLPTPVGPRKRKEEPRLRAPSPARLRSTASLTALTAAEQVERRQETGVECGRP
jgi:hypothetical protein